MEAKKAKQDTIQVRAPWSVGIPEIGVKRPAARKLSGDVHLATTVHCQIPPVCPGQTEESTPYADETEESPGSLKVPWDALWCVARSDFVQKLVSSGPRRNNKRAAPSPQSILACVFVSSKKRETYPMPVTVDFFVFDCAPYDTRECNRYNTSLEPMEDALAASTTNVRAGPTFQ
jgi:hypothetical protein